MRAHLLLPVLLLGLAGAVTIRNDIPRLDTDGDIISAGDGCISYNPDDQLYYLFGAHYQPCKEPDNNCYCGGGSSGMEGCNPCTTTGFVEEGRCCGWRNATIAAWSSPDLVAWTKEGLNILPLATANAASPLSSNYGAIFEPCGVYNRKTRFWHLFFLRDGYTLARAVARTAAGPFSVLEWQVPIPNFDRIVDFYFWQNASTGQLLMKHNGGGGESAVALSDDYLTIAGASPVFGKELGYTEGGGIFTHGDRTYVMAGYGCCFCTLGSNGFLWGSDANAPLGNYSLLGDYVPRNADGSSVTHAQQFSVTPVYTAAGVVPMLVGIRFGSAPDARKDHDFQYWFPLEFDAATGRMQNVTWVDSFSLELAAAPPPPPLPPPPAPGVACSFDAPGTCFEAPPGAPGAFNTSDACLAHCAPEYVCGGAVHPGECIPVPPGIVSGAASSCEAACAPLYACSPSAPGACAAVPPGTPGAWASAAACAAACVVCDLGGAWVGNVKAVTLRLAYTPLNATAGAVSISAQPDVWGSNATGVAVAGSLEVSGGWCGRGARCVGAVSSLEAGGPQCAKIAWEAGTWCSPAVDPRCSAGGGAGAGGAGRGAAGRTEWWGP